MQKQENKYRDQKVKDKMNSIKHKIAIMSNKGGVGKSTVTVNLAVSLAKKGNKVGILDADLHGPSVFKMLGLEGKKISAEHDQILPLKTSEDILVLSMSGLIEDSDAPLIWRGPMKMQVIKQFLTEVKWGSLDYLVIDLPPGTGDEPLSILQLIPEIEGVVIVTTPQEIATLDSRKGVNFVKKLNIPITGIMENMSSLMCPHCNKEIILFGQGGGIKISNDLNIPYLGSIPFEPKVGEMADKGMPMTSNLINLKINDDFEKIVDNIQNSIPQNNN